MTDAFKVAEYFLKRSNEALQQNPQARQFRVSNKKLQKLLYYAQVWFYTFNNKKLFGERIEAWVHGPAVPPVYGAYKYWGFQPINVDLSGKTLRFDEEESHVLDQVWLVYGAYDADYLEALTHAEYPWQYARQNTGEGSFCTEEIDLNVARDYYSAKLRASNTTATH